MSKAGKKLIAAAKEAVAIARGEIPMWCKSCGTITRDLQCDCTVPGMEAQQHLVPYNEEERGE